jgi:hypothetical protein
MKGQPNREDEKGIWEEGGKCSKRKKERKKVGEG